ncbi:MAG: hypothetical protein ABIH41_06810, partial [Nanoarchaeota archaeon]
PGDHYFAIDEIIPPGFEVVDTGSGTIDAAGHLKWFAADRSGVSSSSVSYLLIAPTVVSSQDFGFAGSFMFQNTPTGRMESLLGDGVLTVTSGSVINPDCSEVSYLMDYNDDLRMDLNDLTLFGGYYLADNPMADVDGDRVVTAGDKDCIARYSSGVYVFPPLTSDCSLECPVYSPRCGDDHRDVGELCDGSDLDRLRCVDVGQFSGGDLSCADGCVFDTSQCVPIEDPSYCGDGVVNQQSEECDGLDLKGKTCVSFPPLKSGNLSCSASCLFDKSACSKNRPKK